ncbi:MAG: V-type ATP synthase subunit K [Clostridiales bacterium]|jgi:V/A-type H+-transporting ATPase subunit K|nr:V-type ATP synthase subunit K [Clostridiales bacterium]
MEILTNGLAWAILGAGMAVIVTGLGSSKGVSMVGQAAGAVIIDDPSKFGPLLLLQALPGTQGIYGLLAAFLVLLQTGVIGGGAGNISFVTGIMFFLACLPITIIGYVSAILQAKVAISGVHIVSKHPSEAAKGMTLAAMVETYAVLALLVSVLIIMNIKL